MLYLLADTGLHFMCYNYYMSLLRCEQKARAYALIVILLMTSAYLCAQIPHAREYLRRARVAFEAGNLLSARNFLHRAQEMDPESKDIQTFADELGRAVKARVRELSQRARFFIDARNIPDAEKLLSELMTLDPENTETREQLDKVAALKSKIDDYRSRGIVVSPKTGRSFDVDFYSAISNLNRARALIELGKRDEAAILVEEVLQREPGYSPAVELMDQIKHINELEGFVARADSSFLHGRMNEALEAISRLIERSPERFEYYLMRARANLALKRFAAAEKDLWIYYGYNPEVDVVFPLLSDCLYGQKNYLKASGFSFNPVSGKSYKGRFYRATCYYMAYPAANFLLITLCMVALVAFFHLYRSFDEFAKMFPKGGLITSFKCIWALPGKQPERYLGDLVELARKLNVAWINYIAAVLLFKVGQIDGAQRFFAYSIVEQSLRPRACYFFALTKKLLGQQMVEDSFEDAILAGLGRSGSSWHPGFVKAIERKLILDYSDKNVTLDSFEGMALKLVNEQVGEKL